MIHALINAALVRAELNPDHWLAQSQKWATREGKLEKTGLAGHICWEADLNLWWASLSDISTNYVRVEGILKDYEPAIAHYAQERLLTWPEGTCAIFLAARFLTKLEEVPALRLFSKSGSIDYTKGLVKGFEIGLG